MTVLAWLLLYATVIQLGQSNYSISSEDGTHEVNSYANNKFPFIDRSQVRRVRRSAADDVADLTRKLDDERKKRDRLDGETATALANYETAKTVHQDAVDSIKTEEELLSAKEKEVTQMDTKINDATNACVQLEADYKTAKTKYDEENEKWKAEDKKKDESFEKINKKVDGLKAKEAAAKTAWEGARDEHKKKSGKLTSWQDAKKLFDEATTKSAEYKRDITAFSELDKVKTKKEGYDAKVADLMHHRDEAKKAMENAQTVKNGIDNNKILKKELKDGDPKTFTQPLKDAIYIWENRGSEYNTKPEMEAALQDIAILVGADSPKKVDELIADFANLKTQAQTAFDTANTKYTEKQGDFEANDNKIKGANEKLGPNLDLYNAAKTKKTEADKNIDAVEKTITDKEKEMKDIAKELDGVEQLDEVKCTKEVTDLEKDMNTKKGAWDKAKKAVTDENTVYEGLKSEAARIKATEVDPAEKAMKLAEEKNKKAIEKKEGLEKKKPALEKDVLDKKDEITAITATLPVLKKTEEETKKAYEAKRDEHYKSMTDVNNLEKDLEKATKEKEAAEAEAAAKAKRKEEEAAAAAAAAAAEEKRKAADAAAAAAAEEKRKEDEAAAAAKKEREHQDQVRALSLGFGSTAGIVVIGAAIGLSVFFVMRRRRKQKKAAEVKVPKREELDAPNGLTIIRREGMQDKYVIKGDDFNFRGPLVRGRVHNEVPTKHMLDDQVGGDKIENIFFDKKLNDAYLIGEGVEIVEEDSVSVSEGKKTGRLDPVELLANMSAEDMAGSSQKYIKDTDGKAAQQQPGDKKSSKSKRAKAATPKKAGPPTDDKKA